MCADRRIKAVEYVIWYASSTSDHLSILTDQFSKCSLFRCCRSPDDPRYPDCSCSASPESQQVPSQPYTAAPVQTFVTPAMWQHSVASVYEGGLKRSWDYESTMDVKRR